MTAKTIVKLAASTAVVAFLAALPVTFSAQHLLSASNAVAGNGHGNGGGNGARLRQW